MASEPTPSKPGGMMSLYANLLDPSSDNSSMPGTISRAPVVFKQAAGDDAQQEDAASKKQQISAASLRFQPTKRPQLASQKAKAKPGVPKAPVISSANAGLGTSPVAGGTTARAPAKTTLADWTATADDDDVNGFYGGEKRQRGGRKKRKKNKEETNIQNWDDIYDPSRPNSYEAYKHSEEKIREVREWKDRLYAHRMARRTSSDLDSEEEYSRPRNRQFAPPGMNFAPPPNLNAPRAETQDSETTSEPAAPPVPSAPIPDDQTGDDAYARRLRMSQNAYPPPDTSENTYTPPPPPPSSEPVPPPPAPPQQPFASATISRAPVRYTLPPAPEDIPATEAELEERFASEQDTKQDDADTEAPRSLRPGQKGFAERLLSKYGWTKGTGLGASGSGIVKPLQVKLEKQKKRPDSEGGGFATPAGRARIIGGQQKKADDGKFGAMSEVVILHGMVDGMDLDAEMEGGGLMQEIGEECAEKYGRVERVFIDRNSAGRIPVFVKFTSQLSALRAVNALEGRIFNGNAITARFFDVEKFEQGIYEE
ncbi:hypothetical protein FQN50_000813 [Emmonsiellopsis sp. PD_5]|nr:hypothetical protein FQN50_000813 [Emmonsiellopsis sp. PD_5]